MFGRSSISCRMPFAASAGFSLPSASASSTKSDGSRSRRSTSRLRNASHCAWPSSMTLASMRPASRKLLALERRGDRQRLRRHGTGRHVRRVPIAGIGDEHDLRAALVLAQHVRARADRMRAEVEPVRLDDLARDGRRVRHRERVEEAQIGLRQANAQRVAIDDLEARRSARRSRSGRSCWPSPAPRSAPTILPSTSHRHGLFTAGSSRRLRP